MFGYVISKELAVKIDKAALEDHADEVLLEVGSDSITLDKSLLAENRYRQLFEQKLVKKRDGLGRPIIEIYNIEPLLLPVLKDVLAKKKFLAQQGDYSVT